MQGYGRIARRITGILFLSQGLSSAGFIAAFTVNALVAVDLTGMAAMAGVPGALYVTGQACGALLWGFAMERIGRRGGLALGQILGVLGSAVAMAAIVQRSFAGFLLGLIFAGLARSAVELGRFAAAEIHRPAGRGRAIATVILGSTVGAIGGPLLVGPTGRLAREAGLPDLAGPYGVGFVGLLLAAGMIFWGLRPDPRDLGRALARRYPDAGSRRAPRPLREIVRQPGVIVAMGSVVFAQLVMMVPMSITSVHMTANHHPLTAVSVVISAHTMGMFAFSLLSGRLTDRWGRGPVIVLGSAISLASCLLASPSVRLLPLVAALFLLGLGWNLAYVAGSTLLADQLSPQERSKTQGVNDLLLNATSAASQLGSGLIYASHGFGVMALAAAAAAVVPLLLALWWQAVGREM